MILGDDLAMILAAALLVAAGVGALLLRLWQAVFPARRGDTGDDEGTALADLLERLAQADAALAEARAETETTRLAAEAERAELTAAHAAALAARESALREARAEAQAAMDGLGLARQRLAELQERNNDDA